MPPDSMPSWCSATGRTMVRRPSTQRALRPAAWSLADRRAWEASLRPGASLLDPAGALAHLSVTAANDLSCRYAYFLDFAADTGHLAIDGPPAASVTPDSISAYVDRLDGWVSSVTVAQSVWKVLRVAETIAPAPDWTWLRDIAKRLDVRAVPANKRWRIVEADRLFDLGLDLMEEADGPAQASAFARALIYRDGLMIALLAACPIRRGNFTALEIGRTLVRTHSGWTITIPGAEVKTGRAIEMPCPDLLTKPIDRYLANFRPRFRNADQTRRLWLSRNGRPLSDSGVFQVIVDRTSEAFGHAVNPHLFRDCAATTIAIRHGEHIDMASALLSHVDPRTTERYYNQAGMIDAVRTYQDVVMGTDV